MFIRMEQKKEKTEEEKKLNELLKKISKQYARPDILLVKNAVSFIRRRLASREFRLIKKAYAFSKKKHGTQKRFSGEPYFTHLISTALILSEYNVDAKTISAALLHDVLEDTDVTKEELEKEFGAEIVSLVSALTKAGSEHKNRYAYMKKLLSSACADERVLLIKLADKLHNLRTIEFMHKRKRRAICKQALDFYAPLAELAGLQKMAYEMQDICFSQLWPKEYEALKEKLEKLYNEKEEEVNAAIEILRKKLIRKPFATFVLKKEKKNLYHYFKKINEGKTLEELYDFVSLVIVANSKDACYLALKIVHENFYPMPRKFKDFIAVPSGNYKALHTSVIGPKGKPIKVYIRTKETDEFKEWGISKMLGSKKVSIFASRFSELAKLPQAEFEKAIKSEHFGREITVFDENGKAVFLPQGSSVLDFAFRFKPESAPKLIAAKVHGKFVSLSYELKPADRVELFYAEEKQADKNWLNLAKRHETKQLIAKILQGQHQ